jgi:small-conductance mechanosensitive channel
MMSSGGVYLDVQEILKSPYIVGPLAFLLWVVSLTLITRVIYRKLHGMAHRTSTDIDDILIGALRIPVLLLILVSGAFILVRILPLEPEWNRWLEISVKVSIIVAGLIFTDALVRAALRRASGRVEYLRSSPGVVHTAVRGLIVLLAILIGLDTMGVSITPIIASLGVGSLAVALALQSPLANFFAGIQIAADKPVEVGQYIKLDSGQEGYVTRIGWRSTTIRALPNNLIVVPNSKVMDAIITNYYLPEKALSVLIDVGVSYASDLEQVERVTVEVARDVLQTVEGGKRDFEPFIRYNTFGDSSIGFTVILRAEEFVNGYLIKHEFVKRLHRRYREEGIVIPFPIRTLDIKKDDLLLLRGGVHPGGAGKEGCDGV